LADIFNVSVDYLLGRTMNKEFFGIKKDPSKEGPEEKKTR
jgi:hypothetical protein